ncbi:hypothetical protein [Kitasatospora sp. NPDC087315]|uniref:hypothetical protein n=1 Tax=Kitasatospora sp. NPDC087315 TaxID=3364069 RepID=UPI0038279981
MTNATDPAESVADAAPDCPECSGSTLPFSVDGEDIWRCPACGRRTYGTGNEDDDGALPTYTETCSDDTMIIYHGRGEVDLEASAELASQDGPDDEDEYDHEDTHAGCIEPHRSADGYVDCDGMAL